MKKKVVLAATLLLMFSIVFSACGTQSANSNASTAKTDSTAASASPAATTAANQKTEKLRIFYVTSGAAVDENFNYASNPILDKIARKANVEIAEAIVPPWSDTVTKYNLMMSSGNICDVVHFNGVSTLNNDGKNGAFLDLTDIIKNSAIMKERYAKILNQLKDDEGKTYCLRPLPNDGDINNLFFVRWDILQDLGYNELPKTLDGYLDAMRALKKKYPDSIPYTTMSDLHFAEFVFNCYGITGRGNGWQQYFGKAIMQFEHPLYKDALKVYQTMLKEGLMDPEFVTSKRADFDEKRYNRKVLVNQQNAGMGMVFFPRYLSNGILEARSIVAPYPVVDNPKVDMNAVYEGPLAVGNTGVAIASASKKKEGAIRFVEELLSEETKTLSVWGIENIDYKVVNGEKVQIIDEKTNTKSRSLYSMLFPVNTVMNIDKSFKAGIETLKQKVPNITDAEIKEYTDLSWKQYNQVLNINNAQPSRAGFTYFITLNADTQSRAKEANAEALTIIIKAMRGDISLAEFDTKAADFIKKYQFITDEYNAKLPAAMAKAK